MAQEVYHIRLNSGEDLISEVAWPKPKEGHETHIVLKNPMKIVKQTSYPVFLKNPQRRKS